MLSEATFPGSDLEKSTRPPLRAAEYVRMSTEHQRYSTTNQADVIRQYAARQGLQVVKTYADEGKSGLRLDGRDALKQLIADVQAGYPGFETILVYDISRWGRFQDADESAYYEYICRRAGISVQYCAEQFENDGSPVSTIVKGVKRAMAGEYSRELSAKVFAGQCRLIEMGYRQGGPAGYGLRRQLVDEDGDPKSELAVGEHKSIQTDRVVLIPGPDDEIEVVRGIYESFTRFDRTEAEIAAGLNANGVISHLGRPWTRGMVHQILINEKYIGNNVWNHYSYKLKQRRVRNSPEVWIRADGVFESIVDKASWEKAQDIICKRANRYSDDELLGGLRRLYDSTGFLSGLIIDEDTKLPSSSVYRGRFGSLLKAYELVGFSPDRDYEYVEINRSLRSQHPKIVEHAISNIEDIGGHVNRDKATDLLFINGEFRASIVIARCQESYTTRQRWHLRFDTSLRPDVTVGVRMKRGNEEVLDYFLFPRIDVWAEKLRLAEWNPVWIDTYRFDDLQYLFAMAARASLTEWQG